MVASKDLSLKFSRIKYGDYKGKPKSKWTKEMVARWNELMEDNGAKMKYHNPEESEIGVIETGSNTINKG